MKPSSPLLRGPKNDIITCIPNQLERRCFSHLFSESLHHSVRPFCLPSPFLRNWFLLEWYKCSLFEARDWPISQNIFCYWALHFFSPTYVLSLFNPCKSTSSQLCKDSMTSLLLVCVLPYLFLLGCALTPLCLSEVRDGLFTNHCLIFESVTFSESSVRAGWDPTWIWSDIMIQV